MALLDGDIVASVDSNRRVKTSHSSTGELIKDIRVGESAESVTRLNETTFAVATIHDGLFLISHSTGCDLAITSRERKAHSPYLRITAMAARSGFLVTASLDKLVRIWDASSSLTPLFQFQYLGRVLCVAIDDNFVVSGCEDGKIFVRHTRFNFPIHAILHPRACQPLHHSGVEEVIRSVFIIANDVLAFFSDSGFLLR